MRCFIAINLNEELKMEIDRLTAHMKKGIRDVRWVPAENLHITLKFLGAVPDESVEEIREVLSQVSAHYSPFDVELRGMGLFPDRKRPRVVWIDILNSEKLIRLQEEVELFTERLGFKREERQFSPHLTIGRVRTPRTGGSLVDAVEELKNTYFGNIRVDMISLMKSDLKPTGAQYSVIAEFPFRRRKDDQ